MNLHPLDVIIIGGYLALVALVGVIVRKRATKKLDSFYLADRNVPWWMLGLSGCSSYIDIGGTMSMIGVLFYLGLKSLCMDGGHVPSTCPRLRSQLEVCHCGAYD